MPARTISDVQLVEAWGTFKSATKVAKHFGITVRNIHYRLQKLRSEGAKLECPDKRSPYFGESEVWGNWQGLDDHPGVINLDVKDGVVMVGSDSHYWPGIISTAHRAFVHFAKELQPKVIVKNGDELDFPRISKHAPIGWEDRPQVEAEIEAAQERLQEIEEAAPNAIRTWPIGNHDARFETRLATIAPEYARVHGVHLKDHFPMWRPCWMTLINNDVVVKHRERGGVHATYNNTLHSGKTIVTGHLHALNTRAFTDYNGTRWGVDCGTMADPYGPQFYNYTELRASNWRSGFVVLTFEGGVLNWPEHVWVRGPGEVDFRGKRYRV